MHIKHGVKLTQEEEDALFSIPVICLKKTYPNVEAENNALEEAKVAFHDLLKSYIKTAFRFGEKIGEAHANEKDVEMYSSPKV